VGFANGDDSALGHAAALLDSCAGSLKSEGRSHLSILASGLGLEWDLTHSLLQRTEHRDRRQESLGCAWPSALGTLGFSSSLYGGDLWSQRSFMTLNSQELMDPVSPHPAAIMDSCSIVQWCAGKPAFGGWGWGMAPTCRICRCLWCKYSHCGLFQATLPQWASRGAEC
jgi:hypothetical protein